MKQWLIGAIVGGVLGVGAYLALSKKEPEPQAPEPAPSEKHAGLAPALLPASIVLAEVVDVADLDSLLDPSVKPAGGVPFDPEPPVLVSVSSAPPSIPPAVD